MINQSLRAQFAEFSDYPDQAALEHWIAGIHSQATSTPMAAELLPETGYGDALGARHMPGNAYVRFTPVGMAPFYGYWQPVFRGPAPLLIHMPGYGTEISMHPDLTAQGFNVLHVNPLGYCTPSGRDLAKFVNDAPPVLPETVLSGGERGYADWLANCLMAIRWAQSLPEVLPDRLSFFGTSQGGGGALLLGSLLAGKGARCVAADLPFLTHFPYCLRYAQSTAYPLAGAALGEMSKCQDGWRGIGLIDTLSHAHRLNLPVLLTAGSLDMVTPAASIEALFASLPSTKSYTLLQGVDHSYTRQFIPLATAWFKMYA